MAAGDVRVLLNVDADDNVSAIIKQTNVVMKRFGKNAVKAGKDGSRAFIKMRGVMKNASTTFTEMNSKIALVQTAFFALQRVGEHAISGEIANNAEKIFAQVIGSTEQAQTAMNSLRKSTKGIIDDTSLQVFASRLLIAGSQMKDVAGMAELAGKVALATGRQVPEVMQKLQDAILGGRQTEFRRLGVAVDLNKTIKEQIELEGRRVDDLEMSELITRRLTIVTEKLTQAMDAAGINTEELSTHLRGLKADLDNLESTAQQTLARAISPEMIEERAGLVSKTVQRVLRTSGAAALTQLFGDGELVSERFQRFSEKLAKETGLSVKAIQTDIRDAVLGAETITGERAGAGFFDHQAAFTEAGKIEELAMHLAERLITADRERFADKQKLAQDAIANEDRLEKLAGKEKSELKKQIHDMEVFFFNERSNMTQEEQITMDAAIRTEKLNLQLKEEKIDLLKHELEVLKISAETMEKLEKLDAPKPKKAVKKGPSAAQIAAERKRDNDRMMRAIVEDKRLQRSLEIEHFKRQKSLTIVHALEMEDIRKKFDEERMLNTEMTMHEQFLLETKQQAEEIRMAHTQADQLLEIEKGRQAKIEELHKAHAEHLKEMREQDLEEFQRQAESVAGALGMLQGPLIQLVDHEKGASRSMKRFGATMGATSAAATVYAQETDTSADATDRLKQGLPSMVSAGGTAAAAFVKQTKTKAMIQGGFEAASSLAAFATGNIVGGAGHAAAAAAFFALAGKSKGKASSGLGSKEAALTSGGGGTGMSAATGGSQVTVNVQGFALGSAVDMGSAIGRTVDTARHTGLDSSEV
tara:strand:+ start:7251 stop:9692 length:2442 start_codon:yes stop_codon:yes gene_type:complete